MEIFETNRMRFRRLTIDDFDDLFRMYADPDVRRYFPDGIRGAEETRDELVWFLNGHPDDPRLGLWAAIEKSSGDFIGRCGLLKWSIDGIDEIEIAYMIDKSRWGEGLGSEAATGLVGHAFEALDLSRVIALIDPGHEASKRTAAKAGLRYEKQIRMDRLDTLVYSRFKVNAD